jgi:hypothetical protein
MRSSTVLRGPSLACPVIVSCQGRLSRTGEALKRSRQDDEVQGHADDGDEEQEGEEDDHDLDDDHHDHDDDDVDGDHDVGEVVERPELVEINPVYSPEET